MVGCVRWRQKLCAHSSAPTDKIYSKHLPLQKKEFSLELGIQADVKKTSKLMYHTGNCGLWLSPFSFPLFFFTLAIPTCRSRFWNMVFQHWTGVWLSLHFYISPARKLIVKKQTKKPPKTNKQSFSTYGLHIYMCIWSFKQVISLMWKSALNF